jgi:hypothetical protein
LRDRVQLEMSYLKPVEEKEPVEEGPRGQREALLVEGPEDDRLRSVLRRELVPEAAFHPKISFSGRSPRSTRSWMSSSRRLLGAHTSEGGSTSAAPLDTEEEDFGDSPAISSGGGWIRSMEGAGRTTGGEKEKREQPRRQKRDGQALPLLKRIRRACNGNPEDRAGLESTFQK